MGKWSVIVVIIGAIGLTYLLHGSLQAEHKMKEFTKDEIESLIKFNDRCVESALKIIIWGREHYKERYGYFPRREEDLAEVMPRITGQIYNNTVVNGYQYLVIFKPDGYKIVASPQICGTTGSKIFVAEDGKETSLTNCK